MAGASCDNQPVVQRAFALGIAVAVGAGAAVASMEQLSERPLAGVLAHGAIGYSTRPTHDLVADLARRVDAGELTLEFDETTGYLRPVLEGPALAGASPASAEGQSRG